MKTGFLASLGMTCLLGVSGGEIRTGEVRREGRLAKEVLQHPWASRLDPESGKVIEEEQDYLDVVADGKPAGQVILVFEKGAERPKDRDRLIEVTGRLEKIDLGGPEGTKQSYKGEAIHVRAWRYAEDGAEDAPKIRFRCGAFWMSVDGNTLKYRGYDLEAATAGKPQEARYPTRSIELTREDLRKIEECRKARALGDSFFALCGSILKEKKGCGDFAFIEFSMRATRWIR